MRYIELVAWTERTAPSAYAKTSEGKSSLAKVRNQIAEIREKAKADKAAIITKRDEEIRALKDGYREEAIKYLEENVGKATQTAEKPDISSTAVNDALESMPNFKKQFSNSGTIIDISDEDLDKEINDGFAKLGLKDASKHISRIANKIAKNWGEGKYFSKGFNNRGNERRNADDEAAMFHIMKKLGVSKKKAYDDEYDDVRHLINFAIGRKARSGIDKIVEQRNSNK